MSEDNDPDAPKRSVSLSINADLLARAAELDVNLCNTLEQALIEAINQLQPWGADDRKAESAESAGGFDPVLLAAAIGVFGSEAKAVHWLSTPARVLGHRRPVDADLQEVLDVIGRLEHGFCA
ncbi:MAG: antitoxin Xre/MbcA/ParS toxin-binding domain-containing protein [Pseudomonadales bacterium]